MLEQLETRVRLLGQLLWRRKLCRIAFYFWAGVSIWDTAVSQFLPDSISKDAPKAYQIAFQVAGVTSGWLPWWAWLLIGAGVVIVALLETVVRRDNGARVTFHTIKEPSAEVKEHLKSSIPKSLLKPTPPMSEMAQAAERLGESMQRALGDEPKIPLLTAARRAYSETDDSTYAVMAERIGGGGKAKATPEELLLMYVNGLCRSSKIWGCKAPSDLTKEQNMQDYIFYLEGDGLVARKGNSRIDNLLISKSDLAAFIEHVRKGG